MENEDPGSLDWARLGRAIVAQRNRLGLSQEDISAAGGPSHATLRRIERGEPGPYQSRTLERLEAVLEWKVGVIDAILHDNAGDDENAWVTDHYRLRENMRVIAGAASQAIRGKFQGTNGTNSTATDTAEATDTATATLAEPGTPQAIHMQAVIAAARAVFNLPNTPATTAAKQAMTDAIHEAIQATTPGDS